MQTERFILRNPLLGIAGTLPVIMKTILLSIILLISTLTFSQRKLTGKYCLGFGGGFTTCIEFKENNSFVYVNSNCLDETIGNGHVEYKNDNINLVFDKVELLSKTKTEITNLKTSNKKEISLKFEVKNKNGDELHPNIFRSLDEREYFFYDEENKNFIVYKDSPIGEYIIEELGYETIKLKINHKNDKKISVIMDQKQAKVLSDTIITIKAEKFTNDYLKNDENSLYLYRKDKKLLVTKPIK